MERALETDTVVLNGTDDEVITFLLLRQVVFANAKDDNPHKHIYEAARDSAMAELRRRLAQQQSSSFKEVANERSRQDALWGGAAHDDKHTTDDWFDYIRYQMYKVEEEDGDERSAFVKIAALAIAALESFDRKASQPSPAEASKDNG